MRGSIRISFIISGLFKSSDNLSSQPPKTISELKELTERNVKTQALNDLCNRVDTLFAHEISDLLRFLVKISDVKKRD